MNGPAWRSARLTALLVVPLVLLALWGPRFPVAGEPRGDPAAGQRTATVSAKEIAVWSSYAGVVEPKNPVMVFSRFRGNPPVVEVAREGSRVAKGDVLARLDSASVERDFLKQQKEVAVAEADLLGFRNAKAPLELKELSVKLSQARTSLNGEQNYLRAALGLVREGLVSEQEIELQKEKVAGLRSQAEDAAAQLELTREYLHPAEIKRLQARLAAAQNELQLLQQQLRESIIRAPAGGIVVYTPVHVGLELRPIRTGDALPANVTFMTLHDSRDMIVHCEVPEAELSKLTIGQEASVQLLAYPGIRLTAIVESISPVAQAAAGRPAWQKSIRAAIRILDSDERVRPGLTVMVHVLSYRSADAVQVPRAAVSWERDRAFVTVVEPRQAVRREVKLGKADDKAYEVLEGLRPGAEVLVQ